MSCVVGMGLVWLVAFVSVLLFVSLLLVSLLALLVPFVFVSWLEVVLGGEPSDWLLP